MDYVERIRARLASGFRVIEPTTELLLTDVRGSYVPNPYPELSIRGYGTSDFAVFPDPGHLDYQGSDLRPYHLGIYWSPLLVPVGKTRRGRVCSAVYGAI